MQNLHYVFHHEYYSDPVTSNETLTRQIFERGTTQIPFTDASKGYYSFVLKTTYPGLLLGLGYPHGAEKGSDAAVKLGFSLDYVSGLPVIPGSTVKGTLRSIQRKIKGDGNWEHDSEDVFFDAYPVTQGQLLAFESITPHADDGLKNPIPIRLLKVRPGVEFLFRFRLTKKGQLTAAEKRELFKELLMLTGIGAKTNVGFGGLEASENKGPFHWLEACGAGQGKAQAAAQKAEGVCAKCGKPTKQNKAGIYYELCFNCNQASGR